MKKILLTIIMVFPVLLLSAGSWNPYVAQGIVSPAPLLVLQLNGNGVCSFNIGNSGSDPLNLVTNQEMVLLITLSYGEPNGDPINAVGGTWKQYFNWTWNSGSNSYTATQKQNIPAGPVQGDITIQYIVTENSQITSPQNGFNINITPPSYSVGYNTTSDDAVSSYTYTAGSDYGDAPISYGSADHTIEYGGHYVYLGTTVDAEGVYQASINADGDDTHGVPDDEDGVTFPSNMIKGTTVSIPIQVSGSLYGYGFLNAWIDWNGDGDFADDGERIFTHEYQSVGTTISRPVNIPSYAITTGPTYARFRFGESTFIPPGYGSSGSAPWGEVEDYKIQINSMAYPTISKTDGVNTFKPGTTTTYTVVVSNVGGPSDIIVALVNDAGPGGGTSGTWSADGTGNATPATSSGGLPIQDHSIYLPIGGVMTYTITVTIPCSYTGNLVNTASVTVGSNINYAKDIDYQNEWVGGRTSDWNTASNWTIGLPDCSTLGAVIPTGATPYPIISTSGHQSAYLTIQNNTTLTINAGKSLQVCGCTNISGAEGLIVKSDKTSGNASFIDNGTISYDPSGSVRVELYITDPTECSFCWHAVSSPVQEALSGVFVDDYLKSHNETTGLWSNYIQSLTRQLNVMQGYGISEKATNHTKVFTGRLNTGILKTHNDSVHRTSGSASVGYNLVGNPYPSFIDIESAGIYWGGESELSIDKKVWFMNASTAQNYQVWAKGTGETWTGTASAGKNIPSMQGFFVHVYESGYGNTHFGVSNAARVAYPAPWYKEGGAIANQLYLSAKDESTGFYDDALVIFDPLTSAGLDQWDVGKMYGGAKAPQLYTTNLDNSNLTINYLPFIGKTTIVPLNFKVQSNGTGNYNITASKLESFRSGTTITLVDKKTSTNQVLTESPVYNFAYTEGENAARFELHFYNPFFGIDEMKESQQVIIYSYDNSIFVKDVTGKDMNGQLIVYNLLGQKIATRPLEGGSFSKMSMGLEQGYYIVEVIANNQTYHEKVYLTRSSY